MWGDGVGACSQWSISWAVEETEGGSRVDCLPGQERAGWEMILSGAQILAYPVTRYMSREGFYL